MDQDNQSMGQDKHNSCSPFWITNIFLSVFNGKNARCKQLADADEERKFQEWITGQKNQLEDTKEVLDTAFKLHMKEQQREYSSIQSELKLDLDMEKDELRLFVKGWPLKLSLQAMQQFRMSQTTIPNALNIVIATHNGGGKKGDPLSDPLMKIYDGNSGVVDHVQTVLNTLGIPSKNVLRFKIGEKATGGAALANIYSMMSTFPTVVIMPRVDNLNRKLIISLGCWYPSSKMPSQRKVFIIDYEEARMVNDAKYCIAKQTEVETAYIAIAAVMNDVYALLTNGASPKFPEYSLAKSVANDYPYIADFMRREYHSLIDRSQTTVFIDGVECNAVNLLLDDQKKGKIEGIVNSILESLN